MKHHQIAVALAATVLSIPDSLAQNRRGMTSTLPVAMTTNALDPAGGSRLQIKKDGDRSVSPCDWSAANFPDPGNGSPWVNYSKTAMFGNLENYVVINAHSSGNAIIPTLNGNGVPDLIQANAWMGVIVSVSNSAQGKSNSLIARRRNGLLSGSGNRTTPGSDLLGHYYGESMGLPDSVRGRNFIEQSAEQMGLGENSNGSVNNEDLTALDFGLGVNTLNMNTTSSLFFSGRQNYYFSVTGNSAADINAQYHPSGAFAVGKDNLQIAANAATIYLITNTNGIWSQPEVFRSPEDLGVLEGVHDIDAIEVGSFNSQVQTIFSIVGHDLESQLMIQNYDSTDPTLSLTRPLMSQSPGSPPVDVVRRIRIDDEDEVDAVCIVEPEVGDYGSHLGTSIDIQPSSGQQPLPNFDLSSSMSISSTRVSGTGSYTDDILVVQVSGWGSISHTGSGGNVAGPPGLISLYLRTDSLANPIVTLLETKDRLPSDLSVEFRYALRSDQLLHQPIFLHAVFTPSSGAGSPQLSFATAIEI